MTKWIRWSGLIGFVAVIALVLFIWLLAVGPLIELSIERFGSQAVGAKVEVDDVSLGLFPVSLSVSGVQVTDKDAPMRNILSFDHALADVELFPLMLGKAIIPHLSLTGVATGTERSSSGALIDGSETASEKGEAEPDLKEQITEKAKEALPSVDEILARASLLTVERGKALEQAYRQHKLDVDVAIKALPSKAVLAEYQTEVDAITKGKLKSLEDFTQRKQQLDALRAKFKHDKAAVKVASATLKSAKNDLQEKWQQLEAAPAADIANISSQYNLDASGAGNVAALLFGSDVGAYAKQALSIYEQLSPLLTGNSSEQASTDKGNDKESAEQENSVRLEGKFIHFKTDRPLPELWIKKLHFTAALPAANGQDSVGEVDVTLEDVAYQQHVTQRPTTLLAKGINLQGLKSLIVTGLIDHRLSPGKDRFEFDLQGLELKKLKLGTAGLELQTNDTSVTGELGISGSNMVLNADATLKQTKFSSTENSTMAKELVAALAHVDRFSVNGLAEGEVSSPSVKVSSDLDTQLKQAFGKRLGEKQAEFETKLKGKLNERLMSYSGDYSEQIKVLILNDDLLAGTETALKDLGKAELSNYKDKLKDDAANKLKDKLKGLF